MVFDFKITYLNYLDKIKELDKEAQGVVKSKKNFPVFLIDDKEMVFKPLSKTKPYSTPYFAYSEVVWSTIINRYFDSKTPIYKLAICDNYDEDMKTKYHHGTIVNSLEMENRKILNLYEVLLKYKEEVIDFNYINFCEVFYDFTKVLEAKIIEENEWIGEQLALQILLSILRLDQNYHYENPLFYEENGVILGLTPPIDHEFATSFMFLDDFKKHILKYEQAIALLVLGENEPISKNLDKISKKYPNVVKYFLKQLKVLCQDLKEKRIGLEDNGYITPFNSYNFLIGDARYKKNDEEKALVLEYVLKNTKPEIDLVSKVINGEIIDTCLTLERELERRLKY